ncbi:Myosin-binding protein C, slow-type, partial [Perkinsus olseni]
MLCTADYPARLGEEGVGDTRSDACRKQIGPVQLDPNLGRFNLPLTPEVFPSDGAYRLWCHVLQRGGLYLRVWDSAWPEGMHRPSQTRYPSSVSSEGYEVPLEWSFASLIWDGFLRPDEDGEYTLSLQAPSHATVVRLYFNYTFDANNVTVTLKSNILYPVQIHLYGLKGGDSATLLWSNGSVPLHSLQGGYLFHSPSLLEDFPRLLNVTNATSQSQRRLTEVPIPIEPVVAESQQPSRGHRGKITRKKETALPPLLPPLPPLPLLLPLPPLSVEQESPADDPVIFIVQNDDVTVKDLVTGNRSASIPRRLSSVPAQPVVVRGGNSENRITIKWDAVSSAVTPVNYTVLVDGEVKVSGTMGLSYTLTPCDKGAYYDFKVYASSPAGDGPVSDNLNRPCGRTPGPTGTPRPRGADCLANPKWIAFEWDPPEDDGGFPLRGYKILRAPESDPFNWQPIDPVSGVAVHQNNFTDKFTGSLVFGQYYSYRVVAMNGIDDLDHSNASEPLVALC